MTRTEENNEIVTHIEKDAAENNIKGLTFEQLNAWGLCVTASLIADISKSLAVIADKMMEGE